MSYTAPTGSSTEMYFEPPVAYAAPTGSSTEMYFEDSLALPPNSVLIHAFFLS